LGRSIEAAGLIVSGVATVAIDSHETIALVVSNTRVRLVDRDLSIVDAQTVTVGIGVREETTLQHTIGGDVNTGDGMRGRESSLLGFGKVVFGVTVQGHLTNGDKRVVL
jgi:hypothetical protein